MEVRRGEVWWADLPEPRGSEPGYRRPLVVVRADGFNRSRIRTVLCVALLTHLDLAELRGNVLVQAGTAGLTMDSVANVTQVVTVDRASLTERVGRIPAKVVRRIDEGLVLVLSLGGV